VDREQFPLAAVDVRRGIMVERLSGISDGHRDLMEMLERSLVSLEEAQEAKR
jgi:hypothetical protein